MVITDETGNMQFPSYKPIIMPHKPIIRHPVLTQENWSSTFSKWSHFKFWNNTY